MSDAFVIFNRSSRQGWFVAGWFVAGWLGFVLGWFGWRACMHESKGNWAHVISYIILFSFSGLHFVFFALSVCLYSPCLCVFALAWRFWEVGDLIFGGCFILWACWYVFYVYV
ncbi:hypothetical protein B0T17DRAFT_514510 [Bombardia bombarda]|uniref:Uncharacterized protein n=1 Tax=Bombardia bombarda TaxID=252184 RepID=A0AA39XIX1_9PEZI|nr:hypothetical protein B0T17DRAFT_514510 [Bombardia bombarda]